MWSTPPPRTRYSGSRIFSSAATVQAISSRKSPAGWEEPCSRNSRPMGRLGKYVSTQMGQPGREAKHSAQPRFPQPQISPAAAAGNVPQLSETPFLPGKGRPL